MSDAATISPPPSPMTHAPFLRRVRIENYKSIGKCDVELGSLSILVGRNGSGKSNFLDVLRFIVDGLQTSLDHAIKSRGGIDAIRRRSTGHPRKFAIELDMDLQDWSSAKYGFEIVPRSSGGFVVKWEHLRIIRANGTLLAEYRVEEGKVVRSAESVLPVGAADRLYLVSVSGLRQFRPVYDALTAMGFYNLNPAEMKELQSPDAGELLKRDGSNIASVVAQLKPATKERIRSYLNSIVPGISGVERSALGPMETLQFKQEVLGASRPWTFYAASMSDGTLRALGALVAVSQLAGQSRPTTLIGIEEPETALHPAAAGALMGALHEASAHTPILVTTHSPDLLEQIDLARDKVLVVQARQGKTEIAPLDPASQEAIRRHLYTPGEMLRMDQLEPDREDLERQQRQLKLFDLDNGGEE